LFKFYTGEKRKRRKEERKEACFRSFFTTLPSFPSFFCSLGLFLHHYTYTFSSSQTLQEPPNPWNGKCCVVIEIKEDNGME